MASNQTEKTKQIADKIIKTVNPSAEKAVKQHREKTANIVKELEKAMKEK